MVIAAGMAVVLGLIIFLFLIPNPIEIGILVEELTEKEVLIEAATTKEVYDNVIRKSLDVRPEVVL